MTNRVLVLVVAQVILISGCSRNAGLRCENQERYGDAREVAPLLIPDDLDPPSEFEALRIPAAAGPGAAVASQPSAGASAAGESGEAGACTEAPPDFFQEGLPG